MENRLLGHEIDARAAAHETTPAGRVALVDADLVIV
jgi:hypothetical protein